MTMENLSPGQSAKIEVEVTRELSTNPRDREGADVLSTPALLGLMERCSAKASKPYIPDGCTTVGYAVDGMRHMAPTAIGARVQVRSVLTKVDRNRLTYSIEAFEGEVKIGVAVHKRAVISKDSGL